MCSGVLYASVEIFTFIDLYCQGCLRLRDPIAIILAHAKGIFRLHIIHWLAFKFSSQMILLK